MTTFLQKKNNAKSNLLNKVTAGDSAIVVRDAGLFPLTGEFMITIWNRRQIPDPSDDPSMEIMKVTSVSGNTFYVDRGQESTITTTHNKGCAAELLFTVGQLVELENAINAGGGGTFLGLSDTPSSFSGQSLLGLRVNAGETEVEFYTVTDADEKVSIDSGATPGYIGASSSDGVLRTGSKISYTDGGDFITLTVDETNLDASLIPFSHSGIAATNINDAIEEIYGTENLWDRIGNVLIPKFAGDDISTTGGYLGNQLTISNATLGTNLLDITADGTKVLTLNSAVSDRDTNLTVKSDEAARIILESDKDSGNYSGSWALNDLGYMTFTGPSNLNLKAGNVINLSTNGSSLALKLEADGDADFQDGNVHTDGNVGIGVDTDTPVGPLQVGATVGSDSTHAMVNIFTPDNTTRGLKITVSDTLSGAYYPFSIYNVSGTPKIYVGNNWRLFATVGIETATLFTDLIGTFSGGADLRLAHANGQVVKINPGSGTASLELYNLDIEDTDYGRSSEISFRGRQSGASNSLLGRIQLAHDGTGNDQKGIMTLKVNDGNDGDAPSDVMTLDSDGYVGIGTASPSASLDIGGATPVYVAGPDDGLVKGDLEVQGSVYNAAASNIVYTNTIDDFPADVAGVITFEDGKEYWLNNAIVTDKRFAVATGESATLRSIDTTSHFLVYTGVGTMFSGTNIEKFIFNNAAVSCPNGTLMDFDGGSDVTSFVWFGGGVIADCDSLGSLNDIAYYHTTGTVIDCGQGLTLTDMTGVAIFQQRFENWKNEANSVFITIAGDNGNVTISNSFLETDSNEKALDIKAASTVTGGSVSNVTFVKDRIFASGSKDQTDTYWKFSDNPFQPDSRTIAQIGFQDNTAEVTIDQTGVPIKVNSASFSEDFAERFTTTSGGTVTYTGLESVITDVMAHLTMRPVSGVNIELGCYVGITRADIETVTFTNATDKVNQTAHGLANGTSIRFSNSGGALPAEIRDDQFYYVVNTATNDFEISSTLGGAALDFTDDGTGTNSYALGGLVASSEGESTSSSTRVESFGTQSLVQLDTGDSVEIFVDNHDTTSNIVVKGIQLIMVD